MATENKIIKSRIDTATNWASKNPNIQPGEICFVEGSTDFKVNTGSSAQSYSSCTTFKGSDTTGASANNSRITIKDYVGDSIGTFTLNQSSDGTIQLPNFVKNAKIDFPTNDVNKLLEEDWEAGKTLRTQIPNCVPTDFILCVFREFAQKLKADGTNNAFDDAKAAINTALTLCNIKS